MPNKKKLEIEPAEISELEYQRLNAIYDALMLHDEVRVASESILISISKVDEQNHTLVLEKPLKLVDICLIWGSPQGRLIRDVIIRDESVFHYDEKERSAKLSRFEEIYGITPPLDLLLLFNFHQLLGAVFDAEYDGSRLFEMMGFMIDDDVIENLDPSKPLDPMAKICGKQFFHRLDYYPFASIGYRYGSYGFLVDYYNKHIVTEFFDSTEMRYFSCRNAWDAFLKGLNQEIPFYWSRPSRIMRRKKYPDPDEEEMGGISATVNSLVADRDTIKSYKWDKVCDELLSIQYVVLQRIVCSYLKRNSVDLYTIRKSDFLRYYERYPQTITSPRGFYMDINENLFTPRRSLPLKFSRFSEVTTIDSIRNFCKSSCDLYLSVVLDKKHESPSYYLRDGTKLTQEYWDLLKGAPEFIVGFGDDNVKHVEESIKVIIKERGQDALLACESILERLCTYAIRETGDGFPLLAYYLAISYWDVYELKPTEMAIRLYKAALPPLGMDKLLETLVMLEETRFQKDPRFSAGAV